ncbi:hypothetical protein [Streptomyces niphimycinicus]|uniref:hypothetical protein n=1 Tax=Streptomyces niphimycinicus TaxID=2842201 RepID=UPI00209A912F|nr:hypothetical protein [Streptomyces niphimycinicus]
MEAREVGMAAQSMYLRFADKDQLARAERGVIRPMFGHNSSSFGEPGQAHPARLLWRQWVDAIETCEREGLRRPDGFGRHDAPELTTFVDRTVDTLLRDAHR